MSIKINVVLKKVEHSNIKVFLDKKNGTKIK